MDRVAASPSGALVGAAAGRSCVLARVRDRRVSSTLESLLGTVTDLVFWGERLAAASYGRVEWLEDTAREMRRRRKRRSCLSLLFFT